MIQSFKISEVVAQCSASTPILARKMPGGVATTYQFLAWPQRDHRWVAKSLLAMPEELRKLHTVFGRPGTPVDIVLDFDAPKRKYSSRNDTIPPVIKSLHDHVKRLGEEIEREVVLESPQVQKHSFHVHMRLKGTAFADYLALREFMMPVHELHRDIDTNIYRSNGMLRTFGSFKADGTSCLQLSSITANPPSNDIAAMTTNMSPEEIGEMSLVVRAANSYDRLLTIEDIQRAFGKLPAFSSTSSPSHHSERAAGKEQQQWGTRRSGTRRELPPVKTLVSDVCRFIRSIPAGEADPWKRWVAVGMSAKRVAVHAEAQGMMGADDDLFLAWDAFSQKSAKYNSRECQKKWRDLSKRMAKNEKEDELRIAYMFLEKTCQKR